MKNEYDVIIIGKGPAGISAALYTSRANIRTLIVGKESVLSKSHMVDNYYGFDKGISGPELLSQGEAQALRFGAQIIEDEVIALEYDFEGTFTVKTKEASYTSKAVLLSSGSDKKRIKIENLQKYEGRGVHYCTTCDGYFYQGKKVAILGYNEYAQNELNEMMHFTDNITVLTNGRDPVSDFSSIPVNSRKIVSLDGSEFIQGVVYEDGTKEDFDGIFIAYGTASSVDFARKLGILMKDNIIEVDDAQKTNMEGLFAAGDCSSKIKQVSVAVGQGAVAGIKIAEYIRHIKKQGGK